MRAKAIIFSSNIVGVQAMPEEFLRYQSLKNDIAIWQKTFALVIFITPPENTICNFNAT